MIDRTTLSIPELLRELSSETATLVRQELRLARAEMAEKAKPVGATAGLFGGTALFTLGAFAAGTTFLIALLAQAVELWLAALIVTVVYGIIAAVLALTGRSKLKALEPPLVPQTTQSVREDIAWAKNRIKSAKK